MDKPGLFLTRGAGDNFRSNHSKMKGIIQIPQQTNKCILVAKCRKNKQSSKMLSDTSMEVNTSLSTDNVFRAPARKDSKKLISHETLPMKKYNSAEHKEFLRRKRNPIQQQKVILTEPEDIEQQSAQRLCQVLTLVAWRNGRVRMADLKTQIKNTQLRSVDLIKQNTVLMQLLNAERDRMAQASSLIKEIAGNLDRSKLELKAMKNENEMLYSTSVDMEIKVTKAVTKYESLLDEHSTFIVRIQNLEKEIVSIQDKSETLINTMAALQDLNDKQQQMNVEQNQNLSIEQNKLVQIQTEYKKASNALNKTTSQLIEKESIVSTLKQGNENILKNMSQSAHRNSLLFNQFKNLDMASKENATQLSALETKVQRKEAEATLLHSEQICSHVKKAVETSWHTQAQYFATKLRPLIIYIVTQRITGPLASK